MKLEITLKNDEGVELGYVEIDADETDLAKPVSEFGQRFLDPAFAAPRSACGIKGA